MFVAAAAIHDSTHSLQERKNHKYIIYEIILLILLIHDRTHSLVSFVSVGWLIHDSTHSLQKREQLWDHYMEACTSP